MSPQNIFKIPMTLKCTPMQGVNCAHWVLIFVFVLWVWPQQKKALSQPNVQVMEVTQIKPEIVSFATLLCGTSACEIVPSSVYQILFNLKVALLLLVCKLPSVWPVAAAVFFQSATELSCWYNQLETTFFFLNGFLFHSCWSKWHDRTCDNTAEFADVN